jgi:hypothetical protein
MTSGAQTSDGRFLEIGWRFPQCSGWLQSVHGAGVVRHCLYLATKILGVGSHQALSYPIAIVVGGAFSEM